MQCYVTYFHIGPGNAVALTHEKKSKRQNDKKTIKKNVKQKKRQKEPLIIKPPSIFPCGSVLGHGRWVSRCSQNFSFTLNQSVTNIFEYSNILVTNIYSDIRSYQFFFCEYIRTFVRVKFVCTNIFGHSLVSVLECKT